MLALTKNIVLYKKFFCSTKTHLLKHITLEQVIFRTEKAIKGIHLSKSRCLVPHTQNKCMIKKNPPYIQRELIHGKNIAATFFSRFNFPQKSTHSNREQQQYTQRKHLIHMGVAIVLVVYVCVSYLSPSVHMCVMCGYIAWKNLQKKCE